MNKELHQTIEQNMEEEMEETNDASSFVGYRPETIDYLKPLKENELVQEENSSVFDTTEERVFRLEKIKERKENE